MRILVVSGSLRTGSYNTALARAAVDAAPDGLELELYAGLGAVPPYDADVDANGAPESVVDLRARITDADALFVVTPEYNGSVPGLLKNAVDWASRPRDEAALRSKPVAVAGATTGSYGALWAQTDLRRILGIAGARVLEGDLPVARAHERFDEQGRLVDRVLRDQLGAHLQALAELAAPARMAA